LAAAGIPHSGKALQSNRGPAGGRPSIPTSFSPGNIESSSCFALRGDNTGQEPCCDSIGQEPPMCAHQPATLTTKSNRLKQTRKGLVAGLVEGQSQAQLKKKQIDNTASHF